MLTFEETECLFQGKERGYESLQGLEVALVGLLAPIQKGQAPGIGGRGLVRAQDVSNLGSFPLGPVDLSPANFQNTFTTKVALCESWPAMLTGSSMWHQGPKGYDSNPRS